MAKSRIHSVADELIRKSREAALRAVQTFNNPLTTFKTETFIVLMVIAWTYLLHAYYRPEGVEYRFFEKKGKRRSFDRTKSGAYKFWELERCLNEKKCPLDGPTKSNLRLLTGLRHEIEHHRPAGLDDQFSGRYLACCLNYERYICQLFGERQSLGENATFTLQFRDLNATRPPIESSAPLPSNVAKYLQEFDAELADEDIGSPYFRRRFLFVPVTVNKQAQADTMIEFVPFDSELSVSINEAYQQVMLKEVERPKYIPSQIVQQMREEGYSKFNMHHHTLLWKSVDAKNLGKGYGVMVAGAWYWYERWVEEVRRHCSDNKGIYKSADAELVA